MPTALFVLLVFSFVPFVFCSRSRWAKPAFCLSISDWFQALRQDRDRFDFDHQVWVREFSDFY